MKIRGRIIKKNKKRYHVDLDIEAEELLAYTQQLLSYLTGPRVYGDGEIVYGPSRTTEWDVCKSQIVYGPNTNRCDTADVAIHPTITREDAKVDLTDTK